MKKQLVLIVSKLILVGKLLKKAGCHVLACVRKQRELPSDSYDE